jgi:uncharacterized protein (UPF0335 family)
MNIVIQNHIESIERLANNKGNIDNNIRYMRDRKSLLYDLKSMDDKVYPCIEYALMQLIDDIVEG